mgnify:CR=1 FL=1
MLGGWLYYLRDGMGLGYGHLFPFKNMTKSEDML